jgi:hypothetical protein
MTYFNETEFINSMVHHSYINDTIDFRGFIKEYISKNTEDDNIRIIIKYAITMENAINIYEAYYRYIITIDDDVLNIPDITYVILYNTFYDDILAMILDNGLDSDCETDVE